MFDFEKLVVYQELISVNEIIFYELRKNRKIDPYLKDQLKRATVSCLLNLAEGTGRSTENDKSRFYTISRSSVYECVAIMSILKVSKSINDDLYINLRKRFEDCSKMLWGLIKHTRKPK